MTDIAEEITLEEFRRDIHRQRGEVKIEKPSEKESWRSHPEALSRVEYDDLTDYDRRPLDRPRPVWLPDKRRWTVGPPVNPIEWQILIQSEPQRGRPNKRVAKTEVRRPMLAVCGWFQISDRTFSRCVSRLHDKHLLKIRGGYRRSKIVDKWLHPDLTGQRAGGEWHQKSIHDYIDLVNGRYGCYTYADRGYYPGVEMPDVITIRPQLEEYIADHNPRREPIKWDWENPVYAESKSARDMRNNPGRLKKQLEQYEGVPLYLGVEDKINEARDTLEDRGRRWVNLPELLEEAEGNMVYLIGSERSWSEKSFEPVLERVKEAFRETYDRKARLKKTGTDPEGRECHDLILYDSLGTPKNVGQVIPKYAVDVEEFAEFYFKEKRLGRITTADYVYTPERKPTYENKTWRWKKRKTAGSRFRSFSV